MKRLLAVLLSCLMLMTAACASADEAADRALIDLACHAVSVTAEMYSDAALVSLFVPDTHDAHQLVLSTADAWKDAGSLHRAAIFTIPQRVLDDAVPLLADYGMPQAVTDHLDLLMPTVMAGVVQLLNNDAQSSGELVAAAVLTLSDICVLDGYPAGYTLILMETGSRESPLAVVIFRIKEDGAARYDVRFIQPSEYTDMAFLIAGIDLGDLMSPFLMDMILAQDSDGMLEDLSIPDLSFLNSIHMALYHD